MHGQTNCKCFRSLLRPQVFIFGLTVLNLTWISLWATESRYYDFMFIAGMLVIGASGLLFKQIPARIVALIFSAWAFSTLVFVDYKMLVKNAEVITFSSRSFTLWWAGMQEGHVFQIALSFAVFSCAVFPLIRLVSNSESRIAMRESLWLFIRQVATNRLGQFLFVAHLIIVVYEFAGKAARIVEFDGQDDGKYWWFNTLANRNFHFPRESLLLQISYLLDLPAVLFSFLFTPLRLLIYPSVSMATASWMEAPLLLACASAQWFLIGFALAKFGRWTARVCQRWPA